VEKFSRPEEATDDNMAHTQDMGEKAWMFHGCVDFCFILLLSQYIISTIKP
jgi:hypothetical protein